MSKACFHHLAPVVLSFIQFSGFRVCVMVLVTVVLFGLIVEPWGSKCIFLAGATALKLWWASNPGAMMHLFTCWIEHRSVSRSAQILLLGIASHIFKDLDFSAWHVKQMFAAEVMRLEAESRDKSLQLGVSCLLHHFPEIPELWLQSCPFKFRTSGGSHSYR